jgi:uncharacterized repeat protein (TIGR03803 family)
MNCMRLTGQGVFGAKSPKRSIIVLVLSTLSFLLVSSPAAHAGAVEVLHRFAGGTTDGMNPRGGLTPVGSTLYGMTNRGGENGAGVVFVMNMDGTGYTVLHDFADAPTDGGWPSGSLTFDGSMLYGATGNGGSYNGYGTAFRMNPDGTDYALLHEFGDGTDGQNPGYNLALGESTLYGVTSRGGDNDLGTVFKMNLDGTGYAALHDFAGGPDDASEAFGPLMIIGSTLYGVTRYGGDNDLGTVFRMNLNGSDFMLLHEFGGGGDDGALPAGSGLTFDGSAFYGVTQQGGDQGFGTIFRVNPDGTGYALLHEFAGGVDDGRRPGFGSMLLDGATLYGTTRLAGDFNGGTVFRIDTDGTEYTLLHEFAGGWDDGREPNSVELTLVGSTLYGMTLGGGDDNGGVVFALDLAPVPEPLSLLFFGTGVAGVFGLVARKRMRV